MSDLRTRIAKILYRCDYDLRDWDKATDVGKQPYYDDADAVIAELGLRQQWYMNGYRPFDSKPPTSSPLCTRYVTEWENDD